MNKTLHFSTLALKSTLRTDPSTGAIVPPITLSTTYARNADGSYDHDYVYSRANNPNRKHLEETIALLEGGTYGFAFSSGMAATTALFQTLRPGDHLLLPDDAYYATNVLAKTVFAPMGIEVTLVPMYDPAQVQAAMRPNTALVWLETPSNPLLNISDIKHISELAHQVGALCAVDNTWATPLLQQPLALGADVVMHSTTKYLGGHSDVLGGCLVLNDQPELAERIKTIQELTGGVPSPFECWLVSRGIRTLSVRVLQQTKNAYQLAEYLERHPKIERVHYPGLNSHPQHTVAAAQMPGGYGAMLSVQVHGDAANAMQLTGQLELFTTATSLGGVESLIEHRKSIEGPDSPTPDNLLRISVGLEHIDDLVADWEQALG